MERLLLALKICAGYVLDLLCGDPHWFPHPVRFIGKLISFLEAVLRNITNERAGGILLPVIVVPLVYAIALGLSSLSIFIEIVLIYTIFASRSLAVEAGKVYSALRDNNLDRARENIGFLVSRDTADLDEAGIARAAVETVSENIVDGIIAPLFFLFIGGVPLAMAYKAVNTLDSMVGYKNERYIDFGRASARLDDWCNYIPARATGYFLMPIAALLCGKSVINTIRITRRDRYNHSSPNSGYPEAAAAGALGIRLGGPASYFGTVQEKPYIGDAVKEIEKEDIPASIRLMYAASGAGLVLGVVVYLFILH
ncbi:MAG: cobalamin biosynthesis protein CobD [bacterium]|nr:cobalamin biosynthesis protein CobD [bacterium]